MTVSQALAEFDSGCPNTVSASRKTDWLRELDAELYRLVCGADSLPDFSAYGSRPSETELAAPPPFDRMYRYYLECRLQYDQGEIGRYNQAAALFTAARQEYQNWYTRTHLPRAARVRYWEGA